MSLGSPLKRCLFDEGSKVKNQIQLKWASDLGLNHPHILEIHSNLLNNEEKLELKFKELEKKIEKQAKDIVKFLENLEFSKDKGERFFSFKPKIVKGNIKEA